VVRGHVPADQSFAQALDRIDDQSIVPPRDRVSTEQDSGPGSLDHALHHNAHAPAAAVSLFDMVGIHCRSRERADADADGLSQGLDPAYIQLGRILSCERSILAIFANR
jgi:hypothetical protein